MTAARRWRCGALTLLAAGCWPAAAQAQSVTATVTGDTEYAVVPLAGGDTDIGFGAGALGSIARLQHGRHPYVWRLEGLAFATVKPSSGMSSPYQDAFLLLTITNVLGSRARLELRPSFTRENNVRYHGIGNASAAEASDDPERDFFQRTHPALVARVRLPLAGPLHATLGTLYAHSLISYGPRSNLARDLEGDSERVRGLLHVHTRQGLNLLEAGMLLDTRDDELAPSAGQLHAVKLRVSPWDVGWFRDRYLQLNVTARAFAPLWRDRLVLAGRLIADLQAGEVPFFELARYDEASALGGANGVRGIPGDRYHGKRKLFGNLELRAALLSFHARRSDYVLGATGFVDGGRVWADLRPAPELDGAGLGLKYGVGGGLRLRKGRTFVLRSDLAWSPDARPLGFYFLAGHMF
jgi:hypothetical protein